MNPPDLPTFGDDWRLRWLVFPRAWRRLHRVARIQWDDGDRISGVATMACGRTGRACLPGVASRMELPRCPRCCSVACVPPGKGAPRNSGIDA